MRKLLFHRDFRGFAGGHLKVWDYFNHARASGIIEPSLYLTRDSLRDSTNPWVANGERIESEWRPETAAALFLAGLDWLAVPGECRKPVINLIQHLRHADPGDERFGFLRRPALRICVSQEVATAISSTGEVNGPVLTICNGLSTPGLPAPASERDIQVLIAGYKQPELAARLAAVLEAARIQVQCLTKQLHRHDYLALVARASVTVFLPHEREGFYLPALEGMALGTFVVCPDCAGNRSFCLHEKNCFLPTYNIESISSACREALARISSGSSTEILAGGLRQAHLHSSEQERSLFLDALLSFVQEHRI